MKVLFWMFIGFDKQSTSTHLMSAIIKELSEAGHSIHILQKNTGGKEASIPVELRDCNVTTTTIPYSSPKKGNLLSRYFSEIQYIQKCKKYIISDYEAVFIQSTTVGGFAVRIARERLNNAIITFNVQDIFPYNAAYSGKIKIDGIIFKSLAVIQRYAYQESNHVITISEDMKNLLIEDGTPAEKISVIYNWGYQDELYDKTKLDLSVPNRLFDKEFFNVVYAGNIGVMQNVDLILETAALMKKCKNIWFHIIGDGAYKTILEKKASALEITNITFWPMQPSNVAPAIYSSADINVIPLVKDVYRTALPSKTAICLACGKPIVFAIGKDSVFGKKVCSIPGCFLIDSGNPYKLREAIQFIMSKGIKNNSITEEYYKCFSQSENSHIYSEIITSK